MPRPHPLNLINSLIYGEEYDHVAPFYVVSSISLLPHPAQAQISSSAPYARKPSAYVSPSVCTHTKQQRGKITNYKSKINWGIKVLWDNKGYTRTDRLRKVTSPRLHWQRVIFIKHVSYYNKIHRYLKIRRAGGWGTGIVWLITGSSGRLL